MNILCICPYLPSEYSGHAGAQLIYRNLTALASDHIIAVAAFYNHNEEKSISELEEFGMTVFPILYERNMRGVSGTLKVLASNLIPYFKSVFRKKIFFIEKYHRGEMLKHLMTIRNQFKPDIVQVDYNVMHHYADIFPGIPKVLVQHDISTKVYERGAKESQTLKGRKNNLHLQRIAENSEPKWMSKFDRIVTLTEEDKKYCNTHWQQLPPIRVIPPPISVGELQTEKNKYELCFVGSMNREPNLQAVELLLTELFPKIYKRNPKASLKIAGRFLPKKWMNFIENHPSIIYGGFVEDIDSFIGSSSLFFAPIKIGAGLKMKITHALACGTAVLTTSVGAEGIPIKANDGLYIENTHERMIEKCEILIDDYEEISKVGKKGRDAVLTAFSSDAIRKKWNKLYAELVSS